MRHAYTEVKERRRKEKVKRGKGCKLYFKTFNDFFPQRLNLSTLTPVLAWLVLQFYSLFQEAKYELFRFGGWEWGNTDK